jgi:hypothetical protein
MTKYNLFNCKKDLKDTEIRVIIWGRNEYNGAVQCNAHSFKGLDESQNLYWENGHIHYHHKNPCRSWCPFKSGMSNHYVFDTRGICISHYRGSKPYAEIALY